MSQLSIFVDQIMRPSFLPIFTPPTRRPANPVADQKRQAVLNCLRAAQKPVSATWVVDYTGYTKASVRHVLAKLVDDGLARQHVKPCAARGSGESLIFWEATHA